MKLTVNEYASNNGITVQTVYSRIKRGSLKSEKINGVLYIIEDIEEKNKKLNRKLKKKIKKLKSEVKRLKVNKKYIKHLKDENIYLRGLLKNNEKSLQSLYGKVLALPMKEDISGVIDTEIIKKKKKKKKK